MKVPRTSPLSSGAMSTRDDKLNASAPALFLVSILLAQITRRRPFIPNPFPWAFAPPSVKTTFVADARFPLSNFEKNGYCVISGIMTGDEIGRTLSLLWDYVEAASKVQCDMTLPVTPGCVVDRNDPTTWTNQNWPASVEGGILPYFGSGQSSASWYVRSLLAVRQTFEEFWSTSDLVTSFDAFVIWRNSVPTERGWFHIDQCPLTKPNFANVQGLVNLIDSSESTGGNVLVRGSHKVFPDHYTGKR